MTLYNYFYTHSMSSTAIQIHQRDYRRCGAAACRDGGRAPDPKEIQAYVDLLNAIFNAEIQVGNLKKGDQDRLTKVSIDWGTKEISLADETGSLLHVVDLAEYPDPGVSSAWQSFIEATGAKEAFEDPSFQFHRGDKARANVEAKQALQRESSALKALPKGWENVKKCFVIPQLKAMEPEAAAVFAKRFAFVEGLWISSRETIEARKAKLQAEITEIQTQIQAAPNPQAASELQGKAQQLKAELNKCSSWNEELVDPYALCFALMALPGPGQAIDSEVEKQLQETLASQICNQKISWNPFSSKSLGEAEQSYVTDVFGLIRFSRQEYSKHCGGIEKCKQMSPTDYLIRELADVERRQDEYKPGLPGQFSSFFPEIFGAQPQERAQLYHKISERAYEAYHSDPMALLGPLFAKKSSEKELLDGWNTYQTGLSGKGNTFENQRSHSLVEGVGSAIQTVANLPQASRFTRYILPTDIQTVVAPILDMFIRPTAVYAALALYIAKNQLPGAVVVNKAMSLVPQWAIDDPYKAIVPFATALVATKKIWRRFIHDPQNASAYRQINGAKVGKALLGTACVAIIAMQQTEMIDLNQYIPVASAASAVQSIFSNAFGSVVSGASSLEKNMPTSLRSMFSLISMVLPLETLQNLPSQAVGYGQSAYDYVASQAEVWNAVASVSASIGRYIWENPFKSQMGGQFIPAAAKWILGNGVVKVPKSIRWMGATTQELFVEMSLSFNYLQLPQRGLDLLEKTVSLTSYVWSGVSKLGLVATVPANIVSKAPGVAFDLAIGTGGFLVEGAKATAGAMANAVSWVWNSLGRNSTTP